MTCAWSYSITYLLHTLLHSTLQQVNDSTQYLPVLSSWPHKFTIFRSCHIYFIFLFNLFAERLEMLRGALAAPRSIVWEYLVYSMLCCNLHGNAQRTANSLTIINV